MVEVIERFFPQIKQTVYTARLDSGIKLTLLPKPGFREVMGVINVNYGGIDTKFTVDQEAIIQPNGIAHFLEHQVFENHGQEDYSQLFTAFGADSNAFTSSTATNYYFTGIDKVDSTLTTLLDLVSDHRFTELSMQKEKTIIKQEIDMYQDDPDYRLYAGALEGLFPDSPLAVDLAGTEESINQISHEDLLRAFKTFYRPNQMHLLLIGDLNLADIETILEEHPLTSQIDNSVKVVRSDLQLLPVVSKQSIRMDVAQSKLAVAFRPQEILKKDLFYGKIVLRLYVNLLLGWTSTVYQDWYNQGLIDDSFDIQIDVNERYQFVMLTLETGQPIAMSAKIKQILKNPSKSKDLTEEHFLMVKKELYGEFFTSLDNIDDLAVSYLEHDFDDGSYFDLPDLLFNLGLDEVCQVGEAFFAHSDAVDYTIFPK